MLELLKTRLDLRVICVIEQCRIVEKTIRRLILIGSIVHQVSSILTAKTFEYK